MPRVKRKAHLRIAGYTAGDIEHLLTGRGFSSRFGSHGSLDWEAIRAAWVELRDELLPAWIAEHPGSRPWAWWAFDATERRQRVDGKPHPFDVPARKRWLVRFPTPHDDPADHLRGAYRLTFGVPSVLVPYDVGTARRDTDGHPACDDFCAEYETEADYLERLDLLTTGECG